MSLNFPGEEPRPAPEGGQVTVLEYMDLNRAKLQLKHITDQVEALVKKAEQLAINDEKSAKLGTEMGVKVATLLKELDSVRDGMVRPHNEWVKQINNLARLFSDPLKRAKEALSRKVGQYTAKVELERRQAEELARKEREALQEQINKEAAEAGVEAPPVPKTTSTFTPTPTVHRSESGSSHGRRKLEIRIVDPAKVPREYCEPSEKLLRFAYEQGGVREVPGVEFEEITKGVFRR